MKRRPLAFPDLDAKECLPVIKRALERLGGGKAETSRPIAPSDIAAEVIAEGRNLPPPSRPNIHE